MDITANLAKFSKTGIGPDDRDASFDFCFNYFQHFRESDNLIALASSDNLQNSCFQLGFYLASWGMYRGSSPLLQHSARYLVPLIQIIAKTDISFWEIDAHCYTEANIERIFDFANEAWSVYPNMSEILITKVMLGVFGNVPAFDMYFMQGCKAVGISSTFKPTERKPTALPDLAAFYEQNAAEIDAQRIATMDFLTGSPTQRKYTRAKVIDMAFFTEGGG